METAVYKIGVRALAAFVLLLALAGAFWGAFFVLERLGYSPGSKADAVLFYAVVALGLAILSFWIRPSNEPGPTIRLDVPRPADVAATDGITGRSQFVNLPYEISDNMVLRLNDNNLPDPPILASIVSIDRSIDPDRDEWMIARLKLHDPKDFERLGKSGFWENVRD
jgi:hypothetical protein